MEVLYGTPCIIIFIIINLVWIFCSVTQISFSPSFVTTFSTSYYFSSSSASPYLMLVATEAKEIDSSRPFVWYSTVANSFGTRCWFMSTERTDGRCDGRFAFCCHSEEVDKKNANKTHNTHTHMHLRIDSHEMGSSTRTWLFYFAVKVNSEHTHKNRTKDWSVVESDKMTLERERWEIEAATKTEVVEHVNSRINNFIKKFYKKSNLLLKFTLKPFYISAISTNIQGNLSDTVWCT